ncbi:SEFIR domain-containing protein [Chromobacterium sp. TRC.1.1.SA]|uniref:SEFIR domain-containing protein n=1 Tax=Chromobacterium indicum TaxID=3110228 RepID=A0ABV0CHD0_9NEIS
MNPPKLFISYSWSNPDHEKKVVDIATELRESGVDVILDKWDLKEGNDAITFMEKMVTDPELKKVAIICDEKYASKADGRAGGVGTETQIISKEVYDNQGQDKFVAVVFEKDEHGKAYLPTYYKSRIYIDLSVEDKYSDNFDQLLRWIYDKPLYIKPKIGNTPSFLSENPQKSLGTTALFNRCIDAIKNDKPHAIGTVDEYFSKFTEGLEQFRIEKTAEAFDDDVMGSIDAFLPYRNQAIQLFTTISKYAQNENLTHHLHRFFESLIPYMDRPKNVNQYMEWDYDNFRFIIHELFLYSIAIFLKNDRITQANYLLQNQYYIPTNDGGKASMANFSIFWKDVRSLDYRNSRLQLNRISLRADLLKERSASTGIDFIHLMQADFVAFMRFEIEPNDDYYYWLPETLAYLGPFNNPFEIFSRSTSKSYFEKSKILLNIESVEDLEPLLNSYKDGSRQLPRLSYRGWSPSALIGYEKLATRP